MSTPKPHSSNIWYKNYFVTVFVIGLPALVVVVCLFFIGYALKIQDSTVRDDWYMDGKALYQDASKDQLAYDLDISGVMRFLSDGRVVFQLNQPNPDFVYPATLSANISHATDKSKDRDFVLTRTHDSTYEGQVQLDTAIPAKYYLQISTPADLPDPWRLIHAQKLPANNVPFAPLPAFAP